MFVEGAKRGHIFEDGRILLRCHGHISMSATNTTMALKFMASSVEIPDY